MISLETSRVVSSFRYFGVCCLGGSSQASPRSRYLQLHTTGDICWGRLFLSDEVECGDESRCFREIYRRTRFERPGGLLKGQKLSLELD